MADYTVIADMSAALLRVLRTNLCPEPVQSSEAIALASPSDKNGDFQLGVFLYDIRELNEYRVSAPVRGADNTRTYPDKPLTLHYMLFVNSRAQMATGAETEQRIFGRAVQAMMDNPSIDLSSAQPYVQPSEEAAAVSLLNLSYEEKNRIWSGLNLPYQMGLYLSISPVMISSRHSERFTRVVEAQFEAQQIRAGNARGRGGS